ncbi:MAG: hypothetical protein J6569_10940 [Gilliamella sp.]|uniref:Imm50 family immunity protein n=1 Tax=Gilliamella TaxID=1193503 RepID=UPI000A1528E2|nr:MULTISPECIES: Imm50 family immunity protein [Gilliamella]MCO6540625.1 hypothetical protein [Gilliamella sp.]
MWFENALGREKIQFMFNNEFNFQSIELNSVSFDSYSEFKCHLNCKKIPKIYPKKWDKVEFNALNLIITFNEIVQLNMSGSKIGFFCSPTINSFTDYSEITVQHNKLPLYCKSKFLIIESITPYIDERWN